MAIDRRAFIKRTSWGIGSAFAATGFHNLLARAATGEPFRCGGPLSPVADEATGLELLQLPEGFRYRSFGWTGEELSDGRPTPPLHDGMSVVHANDKTITLCRNHEVSIGTPFGDDTITYDPRAPGGCTTLTFDRIRNQFVDSRASLGGTVRNCAGGPTPWGSWLSCEETVLGPGDQDRGQPVPYEREHGYVFEVPADDPATAQPLKEMGRFIHEAVAVDPVSSIVYETEDRSTAGFYRFLPTRRQQLAAGGRLQMLKVAKQGDMRTGLVVGTKYDTSWVDIEAPTRAHSPGTQDTHGVYSQGKQQGATTFARLEGCWYADGKVWIVSTDGGDHAMGQVFEYDPIHETIRMIFESPSAEVLDHPDNMTVSPSGTIVLCEDGGHLPQRMHHLMPDGRLLPLAANNIVLQGKPRGLQGDFRTSEWAGACFSPDGQWLFANIQTPGITFAITQS